MKVLILLAVLAVIGMFLLWMAAHVANKVMRFLKHFTLLKRFLAGHPMDGSARHDGTFLQAPTKALHPTAARSWWHWRPGWHRSAMRLGALALVLLIAAGMAFAHTVTEDTLMAAAAAGFLVLTWHVAYRIRNFRHERHYVRPLERTLTAAVTAAPVSLEVERDGDAVKSVAIEWPPEAEIGTPEQDQVLHAVTARLAMEAPDAAWKLKGRSRSVVFTQSEPPPSHVEWADVEAAVLGAAANELVFGVGKRGAISKAAYSESPHIAIPGGSGGGKALALDTRLPTPDGWTTMGEVAPGDLVYDETGTPVPVIAATEVMHGRPCYEVQFSDGSVIVADAGHQWVVEDAAARKSFGKVKDSSAACPTRVVTTEVMARSVRWQTPARDEASYSIQVAAPLQCPEAELPVAPYTLGAWLGDGTSANSSFTCADEEILTSIRQDGYDVHRQGPPIKYQISNSPERDRRVELGRALVKDLGAVRAAAHVGVGAHAMTGADPGWSGSGRTLKDPETPPLGRYRTLHEILRDLDLLMNKHIPEAYLRASETQRRALLAGLLDTDGYCRKTGTVEFYSTRERLARDVRHLVASLGYKCSLTSKTATLNGKDCGLVWRVTFKPAEKVFRLTRKTARQVTEVRATATRRYVTDVRPVPSVPVRCIEVGSPRHLYLAGETCIPTHNSNLAAFLLIQEMLRGSLIFNLDPKWISHLWLQDLPNVINAHEDYDLHLALAWLGKELLRRTKAAYYSAEGTGRVRGSVGPRIIVLCEELNYGMPGLKDYWNEILAQDKKLPKEDRDPGLPKKSPAIGGLSAMSCAGRASDIHEWLIAQLLTVESTGVKDSTIRTNAGIKAMARHDPPGWGMAVGKHVPMPPPSTAPGRIHLVTGDGVRETQVPYLHLDDKDEDVAEAAVRWARELVLSGTVAQIPSGPEGVPPELWPASVLKGAHLSLVPAQGDLSTMTSPDVTVSGTVVVTLAEAVNRGIIGPTIQAVRKARSRGDFPEPVGERPGTGNPAMLYDASDLHEWSRSRREDRRVSS